VAVIDAQERSGGSEQLSAFEGRTLETRQTSRL
jgi:hypothetical protein